MRPQLEVLEDRSMPSAITLVPSVPNVPVPANIPPGNNVLLAAYEAQLPQQTATFQTALLSFESNFTTLLNSLASAVSPATDPTYSQDVAFMSTWQSNLDTFGVTIMTGYWNGVVAAESILAVGTLSN